MGGPESLWTPDEDDKLIRAKMDGLTYRTIQREVLPHRSFRSLTGRAHALAKRAAGTLDDGDDEPVYERWKQGCDMLREAILRVYGRGG